MKRSLFIKFSATDNFEEIDYTLKSVIRKAILATLDHEAFKYDAEVSVTLCDNEYIHSLNKKYRNVDRHTDVLSFPMFEYDEDGEIIEDYAEFSEMGDLILGDIVISLERAKEQAEEYGHSFEREVGFLTVHSMLHLLGYDHMAPEDEEEMFGYQKDILNQMGLTR